MIENQLVASVALNTDGTVNDTVGRIGFSATSTAKTGTGVYTAQLADLITKKNASPSLTSFSDNRMLNIANFTDAGLITVHAFDAAGAAADATFVLKVFRTDVG